MAQVAPQILPLEVTLHPQKRPGQGAGEALSQGTGGESPFQRELDNSSSQLQSKPDSAALGDTSDRANQAETPQAQFDTEPAHEASQAFTEISAAALESVACEECGSDDAALPETHISDYGGEASTPLPEMEIEDEVAETTVLPVVPEGADDGPDDEAAVIEETATPATGGVRPESEITSDMVEDDAAPPPHQIREHARDTDALSEPEEPAVRLPVEESSPVPGVSSEHETNDARNGVEPMAPPPLSRDGLDGPGSSEPGPETEAADTGIADTGDAEQAEAITVTTSDVATDESNLETQPLPTLDTAGNPPIEGDGSDTSELRPPPQPDGQPAVEEAIEPTPHLPDGVQIASGTGTDTIAGGPAQQEPSRPPGGNDNTDHLTNRPALENAQTPLNQGTENAAQHAASHSIPAQRAALNQAHGDTPDATLGAVEPVPDEALAQTAGAPVQNRASGSQAQAPIAHSAQVAPPPADAVAANAAEQTAGPVSQATGEGERQGQGEGEDALLRAADRANARPQAAPSAGAAQANNNAVQQSAIPQPLPPIDTGASGTQPPLQVADALTSAQPASRSEAPVTLRFGVGPQNAMPAHLPANSVAFQIARHFENGVNRFQIRIDPPELGRVDVRLDMSVEGRAQAHLTVERAETLDLMQRDARILERALNDAGLNTDRNSLSFSLKDQGESFGGEAREGSTGAMDDGSTDLEAEAQASALQNATAGYITDTGVDITV